jgi:hypothetical protein
MFVVFSHRAQHETITSSYYYSISLVDIVGELDSGISFICDLFLYFLATLSVINDWEISHDKR